MKYKIFSDGGSRGNPGNAAWGFVVYDQENLIVTLDAKYMGIYTNNQAEYQGLLSALITCQKLGKKQIVCHLDSELVVKQLNGEYSAKNPNIKPYFDQVVKLKEYFEMIQFVHIPRSQNSVADKLVNIVLDTVEG